MPDAAATTISIAPETHADAAAIERLLDRAFGPGRFAKVSERVRERCGTLDLALSPVARDGDEVIGCCRIYRIGIGGREAAFLGPLAVDPGRRHAGLGGALVEAASAACAAAGLPAIVLVGAPKLFVRLGFTRPAPGWIAFPGPVAPERVHWKALIEGGLEGLQGPITSPPGASRSATA